MQIDMIKKPGAELVAARDIDSERLNKFKTGGIYPVKMTLSRNPEFHRKVFALFKFCFDHWRSDLVFMDESGQFDCFRKQMTILAGYRDEYYCIDGSVRVEAKSLSYGSMPQEEFEALFQALIQSAMTYIFTGNDDDVYNTLIGFL